MPGSANSAAFPFAHVVHPWSQIFKGALTPGPKVGADPGPALRENPVGFTFSPIRTFLKTINVSWSHIIIIFKNYKLYKYKFKCKENTRLALNFTGKYRYICTIALAPAGSSSVELTT